MGGTTASGFPYVTPTDHPKEFPAHSQALANKLESGGVAHKVLSKTTDATGLASVSAADMGMTLITGCVVGLFFSPGANAPILCTGRVTNGTTISIQVFKAADIAVTPIAFSRAISAAVTLYVIAW